MSERVTLHALWAGVLMTVASIVALATLAIARDDPAGASIITAIMAAAGPITGAVAMLLYHYRAQAVGDRPTEKGD